MLADFSEKHAVVSRTHAGKFCQIAQLQRLCQVLVHKVDASFDTLLCSLAPRFRRSHPKLNQAQKLAERARCGNSAVAWGKDGQFGGGGYVVGV